MTILLDKPKAIELLEAAVAAKGADYVYSRVDVNGIKKCLYVADGKPSCLVAQALFTLKPDLSLLAKLDDYGSFGNGVHETLLRYDIDLTEEAQVLLETAQSRQDAGDPWGKALRIAENSLAEIMRERAEEEG